MQSDYAPNSYSKGGDGKMLGLESEEGEMGAGEGRYGAKSTDPDDDRRFSQEKNPYISETRN